MSELSDDVAQLKAAFGRVQTLVGALKDEVATLTQKVAAGTAAPEDLAGLQQVIADLNTLAPPEPPPAPAP